MTGTDENVRIFLFVLLPALSAHISSSVLVKYNSRCCREGQVVVSEFGEKAYFSIIFFVFFLLDFFEPRPCYPRLVSFSLFRSLSLWSSLPYLLLSSLFSSRSLLLLQFSLTLQKQNLFIWVNVFSMSMPAINLRPRCISKVWYVCTYI